MTQPAPSSSTFESLWAELKLLLEWRQGFSFIVVLGDNQRISERLAHRLSDFAQTRTQALNRIRPQTPATAVQEVLTGLFNAAMRAPAWVDLMPGPTDPDWQTARQQVLSALNQRRSALEQDFAAPLLLHIPTYTAPSLVSWAPDLWSIRALVLVLPTDDPIDALARTQTASEIQQSIREFGKTGDDALKQGQLEDALSAYRDAVDLARRVRKQVGDTPQALRDLAVSLDKIGNVELEAGRWDEARKVHQESLVLSRRLHELLGDTPETLRDLSISLDKIGNVERNAEQWEAARQAYQESLGLIRRLCELLGDTPETFRDLSIALNNTALVESAVGRWDTARLAYQRSLELIRRLREQLGDTPQILLVLSASLSNIGNLERNTGQWDAARQAYQESLNLRRRLREQLGDTPPVLQSLSIGLMQIGNLERDAGQWGAARQAYLESLALSRRLHEHLGDTPQTIARLRVVLMCLLNLNPEHTTTEERAAWQLELDQLPKV
ncbi:MAG: hypothetical protein RLZZ612_1660 [Pseudomonadota bacterium]|jgi:tetratricopeptide (TPR) repeat protein